MDDASVIVSLAAVVISAIALAVSILHRRSDIARGEKLQRSVRVWAILNDTGKPTLRTIAQLDDFADDVAQDRIKRLRPTIKELRIAGAESLAAKLEVVLDQPWGSKTTAQSKDKRAEFDDTLTKFMEV